jgi:hypothetical protein
LDSYDYVEGIMIFIKGITGINFQLQIKEILRSYYKYLNKTYEMPDFYGGDQKNDGWVVEDAVFYQIFAPTRLKNTLKKEIQEKFKDDLTGLLNIIYKEKKWNGEIKEFIFIVNTFDCNLPHDSEGFFEKVVSDLKQINGIDFKFKIVNSDYIRDILTEINDVEVLKQISATLHVKNLIDFNAITETMITDLIVGISSCLNDKLMGNPRLVTYDRISTTKKIDINQLNDRRDEIENIISKLDVVERAVSSINQDVLCENKFERVRDFVMNKYIELSTIYNGTELYDKLINEMLTFVNHGEFLKTAIKFLVVYIFDKCDIFEKE